MWQAAAHRGYYPVEQALRSPIEPPIAHDPTRRSMRFENFFSFGRPRTLGADGLWFARGMGPRHKLRWLAVLALAGACTFGVVASSQASRRPGCGSGWAASAGRPGSLGPGSGPAVRVSHSRSGWRVDLRNEGGHAITGVVSASARVTSLRTTRTIGRALRRGARGFSFALSGRTAGQRITFKLACAHRITF